MSGVLRSWPRRLAMAAYQLNCYHYNDAFEATHSSAADAIGLGVPQYKHFTKLTIGWNNIAAKSPQTNADELIEQEKIMNRNVGQSCCVSLQVDGEHCSKRSIRQVHVIREATECSATYSDHDSFQAFTWTEWLLSHTSTESWKSCKQPTPVDDFFQTMTRCRWMRSTSTLIDVSHAFHQSKETDFRKADAWPRARWRPLTSGVSGACSTATMKITLKGRVGLWRSAKCHVNTRCHSVYPKFRR